MKTKETKATTSNHPAALLQAAAAEQRGLLSLLRRLVEAESPSCKRAAVNRCVDLVVEECLRLGGKARRRRQKVFGDILEIRFGPARASRKPIMLLGHLDTVWPLGALRQMPFRIHDGRAWGPGVLDMKAGVAMALTALGVLRKLDKLQQPVLLLLNSEEEVGSPVSRAITERLARECAAVYVLEPAQGLQGAYKTARKGVGDFHISIKGVASHSGVDFNSGHSAILELARQIGRIANFTDPATGITVNPGVVGGGTQANVIAAEAWAHVDLRIAKASDAEKMERKFKNLRPSDRRCSIEVAGGINRPPMERTRATVDLFRRAATLASAMGFALAEASTGGGSDGNFTSAIGVPTLDGMGAVGEGAHALHESILLEHLAPRTALLAAMIGGWSDAESG